MGKRRTKRVRKERHQEYMRENTYMKAYEKYSSLMKRANAALGEQQKIWDFNKFKRILQGDIKQGLETGAYTNEKEGIEYLTEKAFRDKFNIYGSSDDDKLIRAYSRKQAEKMREGLIIAGEKFVPSVEAIMTGEYDMATKWNELRQAFVQTGEGALFTQYFFGS